MPWVCFTMWGVPLLILTFDNYAEVMRESYEKPAPRIFDTENQLIDTNLACWDSLSPAPGSYPKTSAS